MKSPRPLLFLSALVSALLFYVGCSKSDQQGATAAASDAYAKAKVAMSDTWNDIKDFTYDRRVEFSNGIDRMSKDMDEQAAKLKDKTSDTASTEKQSASKEYDEARASLKSSLTELNNATADHWADAKAKVVEAWKRVQAAWDRRTKADASP